MQNTLPAEPEAAAGKSKTGVPDVSIEHDRYLNEQFRS